jgi:hypothetical protein
MKRPYCGTNLRPLHDELQILPCDSESAPQSISQPGFDLYSQQQGMADITALEEAGLRTLPAEDTEAEVQTILETPLVGVLAATTNSETDAPATERKLAKGVAFSPLSVSRVACG